MPEDVTRLATLISGEVQVSDVPRALQKDAAAKGMQVLTSKLPAIQHQWQFGGMYFASPDKLDATVPFVKKEVRQAMNLATTVRPSRSPPGREGGAAAGSWLPSQARR